MARAEVLFGLAGLVQQAAPEAAARHPALPEALLDQAALSGEDLDGQLPAVLAGHDALDGLEQRGPRAPVVVELLRAVVDLDAGPPADMLVIPAFVGVLESASQADVVHRDGPEVGPVGNDIRHQVPQALAALDRQERALALIEALTADVEGTSWKSTLSLRHHRGA